MARAAERAGRDVSTIRLVAVTKTHPPEAVREAHAAGVRIFGENRVQEAEAKVATLKDLSGIHWHLVGHLQANKARKALTLFETIHSVDSIELGERLGRLSGELGGKASVLVEVEMGGEATKHGFEPNDVLKALERLRAVPSLNLEGLMCIPPPDPDPEKIRPHFRSLKRLLDDGKDLLHGRELSMGMSHDFEVAIEEGATLVRVGTAIFGERS